MTELQKKYIDKIKGELKQKFEIKNDMAVPTLEKIVVNAGIGKEYSSNTQVVDEMKAAIAEITGQMPVVTKSKVAISNFKLREGTPNGLKVTLRGDRMWDFFYKLVNIAMPRIKDFRGVTRKAFDKRGNYTLGIKEHTIFPEIDTSTLVRIRSLQVVINTTAGNDESALALLELLGFPFQKERKKN